jgi:hypothetical protein
MLQPITDPELADRVRALVDAAVERPWHVRPRPGWTVVPVEKGRHFEDDDAERIAAAVDAELVYAAVTETGARDSFVLPASEAALEELSEALAGRNVALVGPDLAWLVLLTSEGYNLLAGPEPFVHACLGTDITGARDQFRAFASDPWWEGRLLEVAERYERD